MNQGQLFRATMAAYENYPEPATSELITAPLPATPALGPTPPPWQVEAADVVTVMSHLTGQIGVMNFASPVNPGGGVAQGFQAQEESLAKGTYLVPALQAFKQSYYAENRANPNSGLYTRALIYSAGVRQLYDEHQNIMPNHYLDIVTVAAPNRRVGRLSDEVALADIAAKITQTLRAFKAHGADQLVLGAFGAGVFGNPPEPVGRLFGHALAAPEFHGAFTAVVFAVYDRGGHILPPFERGLTAGFQEATR